MDTDAAACPTSAIPRNGEGRYFVDQSLCIKVAVHQVRPCRELRPDVIVKLHVFDAKLVMEGRVPEPVGLW